MASKKPAKTQTFVDALRDVTPEQIEAAISLFRARERTIRKPELSWAQERRDPSARELRQLYSEAPEFQNLAGWDDEVPVEGAKSALRLQIERLDPERWWTIEPSWSRFDDIPNLYLWDDVTSSFQYFGAAGWSIHDHYKDKHVWGTRARKLSNLPEESSWNAEQPTIVEAAAVPVEFPPSGSKLHGRLVQQWIVARDRLRPFYRLGRLAGLRWRTRERWTLAGCFPDAPKLSRSERRLVRESIEWQPPQSAAGEDWLKTKKVTPEEAAEMHGIDFGSDVPRHVVLAKLRKMGMTNLTRAQVSQHIEDGTIYIVGPSGNPYSRWAIIPRRHGVITNLGDDPK